MNKDEKTTNKHGFTRLDIIEIVENGGLENWTKNEQKYIKNKYNKLKTKI
jgi:hypothetical protein